MREIMENYKLVMPEHMNHYGYLFGGKLLSWVDEYAWIAASVDYPRCRFVTIGMQEIEFNRPVPSGAILRFLITQKRVGRSSVHYDISVSDMKSEAKNRIELFHTTVSFVNIGPDGNKAPLPAKAEDPVSRKATRD